MDENLPFPTPEMVADVFEPFKETNHCSVKLIGVRGAEGEENEMGVYDDAIFRIVGKDITRWEASTDPGQYWINHPMNPKGCARLCVGLWWFEFGLHRGHEALVQRSPFEVDRLDYRGSVDSTEKGMFGINLHSGGPVGNNDEEVGRWSAGCQIIKTEEAWDDKWKDFFSGIKKGCKEASQNYIPYLLVERKTMIEGVNL